MYGLSTRCCDTPSGEQHMNPKDHLKLDLPFSLFIYMRQEPAFIQGSFCQGLGLISAWDTVLEGPLLYKHVWTTVLVGGQIERPSSYTERGWSPAHGCHLSHVHKDTAGCVRYFMWWFFSAEPQRFCMKFSLVYPLCMNPKNFYVGSFHIPYKPIWKHKPSTERLGHAFIKNRDQARKSPRILLNLLLFNI